LSNSLGDGKSHPKNIGSYRGLHSRNLAHFPGAGLKHGWSPRSLRRFLPLEVIISNII